MMQIRWGGVAMLACLASGCSTLEASAPAPALTMAWDDGSLFQFDDPIVADLLKQAQRASPTLAQAAARVVQARAALGVSASAALPTLTLDNSVTRARQAAPQTTQATTLDASWEIDLFGAARKRTNAASARLSARTADWHGAGLSLAAEVANAVVNFRSCNAVAAVLAEDLVSREQTATLTALKVKAGFTVPADADLIDASRADARQRLDAQRAECDINVAALVALTDVAEPDLRARLGQAIHIPHPLGGPLARVPVQVLSRRPDLLAASGELLAAAADTDAARAARLPSISLSGNFGDASKSSGGQTISAQTWSFGPLAVSLPLFDGGRRRADVAAARGRYDEASASYQQLLRTAVREAEEALVRLASTERREQQAALAAVHYERYLRASKDKFAAGQASLFELEDARRSYLAARQALLMIERDHANAWISLYKALGGAPRSPALSVQPTAVNGSNEEA